MLGQADVVEHEGLADAPTAADAEQLVLDPHLQVERQVGDGAGDVQRPDGLERAHGQTRRRNARDAGLVDVAEAVGRGAADVVGELEAGLVEARARRQAGHEHLDLAEDVGALEDGVLDVEAHAEVGQPDGHVLQAVEDVDARRIGRCCELELGDAAVFPIAGRPVAPALELLVDGAELLDLEEEGDARDEALEMVLARQPHAAAGLGGLAEQVCEAARVGVLVGGLELLVQLLRRDVGHGDVGELRAPVDDAREAGAEGRLVRRGPAQAEQRGIILAVDLLHGRAVAHDGAVARDGLCPSAPTGKKGGKGLIAAALPRTAREGSTCPARRPTAPPPRWTRPR